MTQAPNALTISHMETLIRHTENLHDIIRLANPATAETIRLNVDAAKLHLTTLRVQAAAGKQSTADPAQSGEGVPPQQGSAAVQELPSLEDILNHVSKTLGGLKPVVDSVKDLLTGGKPKP